MKVLTDEFQRRLANVFLVGQEIRSEDWKRLVENAHFLWSEHRAMANGAVVFFDGFGGDRDRQDIDYTIPLLMRRPTAAAEVVARVEVGGDNAVIDVDAFVGTTPVGSVTVDGSGSTDWTSETISIDYSDAVVSGEVVPVFFRISYISGEVERVQISEAGFADLDESDIP